MASVEYDSAFSSQLRTAVPARTLFIGCMADRDRYIGPTVRVGPGDALHFHPSGRSGDREVVHRGCTRRGGSALEIHCWGRRIEVPRPGKAHSLMTHRSATLA